MTEPSADLGNNGIDKRSPRLGVSDNISHSESRANTIQEKKAAWFSKRSEIDHITDSAGRWIDEGIKESVVAFNMNGLNTLTSCEGHSDGKFPSPWIVIGAPNMPDVGYETFQRIQHEQGITNDDIEKNDKVRDYVVKAIQDAYEEEENSTPNPEYLRWLEETNKIGYKAEALLNEFYSEREVAEENRLQIDREDKWKSWTIRGGNIEEDIEKKHARTHEEYQTILLARKAEMAAFTDFLREKYMSS